MSTIFLHVGQAGNEIGAKFWALAAAEKPPRQWFFDEHGRCRCVMVDTEPKVCCAPKTHTRDSHHTRCRR